MDFRLSSNMARQQRRMLWGKGGKHDSRTVRALARRGLCSDKCDLTEKGRIAALSCVSLREQCKCLNIPLEEWEVNAPTRPEQKVLRSFRERGIRAYYSENTFGVHVIDFFLFDTLLDFSRNQGKPLYTIGITYYPEFFHLANADLPTILQSIDEQTCQRNFGLIKRLMSERDLFYQDMWELKFYEDVVDSLGVAGLRRLVEMFFSNPLAYSRGWPDILVTGENEPYFIEVKTTDKLHLSQLITVPDLMSWTGILVKCVRLKPVRRIT